MTLSAGLRSIIVGAAAGLLLAMAPVQAADSGGSAATSAAAVTTAAPAPAPVVAQAAASHNAAPMWRAVQHGDAGFTTLKGAEAGVLIQTEGNLWRTIRNGPVTLIGGLLLVGVFGVILLFHLWKGQLRLSGRPTGRSIQRFSMGERLVHNTVAGSFVLLALGGLLLLFGKHLLVPFLGHTVFSFLLQILKPIHNFLGLVFLVALLAMIVMWLRDNVWHPIDAQWISRAGGLIDRSHVPSGRFNFGEKTWFWFGVTILGLTVAISGVLLDFPGILELRAKLQVVNLVHGIGALLMLMLAFGHIYMGTIGVEGAFQSMKTGQVDEVWAKEHHELWFEQSAAKTPR